jgi:glyoxylase-like metal-dependent hydrolase (beta-lactamase superfamily II)
MTNPWEIYVVQHGYRETVRSEAYMNYGIYEEPDDKHEIAYYFWIITNGDRTIHVDTGYSREAALKRKREILITPTEAMRQLGFPADAGAPLVVTHAHYDHIGNVKEFKNSHIYMARAELEFWESELASRPMFKQFGEQSEIAVLSQAQAEGRVTLFTGQYQLADGVTLIETGGHTPGQLVVSVDTAQGLVILASDAAHFHEEMEKDMLFQTMAHLPESYQALDWLRAQDDAVVVSGHDVGELKRFPAIDGQLSKFVSRIA